MTGRAARLFSKQLLSADGRGLVETVRRRVGHAQLKLVVEQRLEFRRHEIRCLYDRDVDPWIVEAAMSAHLADADVAVPVRDRPVSREGLEPDTLQAEDRGDDDRQ